MIVFTPELVAAITALGGCIAAVIYASRRRR